MQYFSRSVTITVQLPDKRILLHRNLITAGYLQWGVTTERMLYSVEDAQSIHDETLMDIFGIDCKQCDASFAQIERLTAFTYGHDRYITPFILKVKSSFKFRAKRYDQYVAKEWEDLLDDVIRSSSNTPVGSFPKYKPTSVMLLQTLNARGIFS